MIIVIDNYDSFTYNLVQYLHEAVLETELTDEVRVFRNDEVTADELSMLQPTKIVISPGPGYPAQAGISNEVIRNFSKDVPILGVCLGHQCLGEIYGARTVRSGQPTHGKTSPIYHDGKTIFRGLSNPFEATRYHSLIVDRNSVTDNIEISAWTEDGQIMGLRIRNSLAEGVQFHPESILTTEGKRIVKNFITGGY
ncbi:aminodeoxychorismate/anthranilate synthase component II [bacterium]|nr:aminodeoxychorismate/anthranilate synthase component II [bacterium]